MEGGYRWLWRQKKPIKFIFWNKYVCNNIWPREVESRELANLKDGITRSWYGALFILQIKCHIAYLVARLIWEHLFLAWIASANPVPVQAIADIPEKVLQTDFSRDLSLQNNTSPRWLLRGTQRQFSENICSEDDLRSRIFGTFVVKFFACLPLLGFSNI